MILLARLILTFGLTALVGAFLVQLSEEEWSEITGALMVLIGSVGVLVCALIWIWS